MFKVNEKVVLGSRQEEVPRRSRVVIFQDGAIVVKKSLEEEEGEKARCDHCQNSFSWAEDIFHQGLCR